MSTGGVDPRVILAGLEAEERSLVEQMRTVGEQLEDIRAAIEIYRQKLNLQPNRPVTADVQAKPHLPEGITLTRTILEWVMHPGRGFATTDVIAALRELGVSSESKNFYNTVYTTLKRLKEEGRLQRMESGLWALPSK